MPTRTDAKRRSRPAAAKRRAPGSGRAAPRRKPARRPAAKARPGATEPVAKEPAARPAPSTKPLAQRMFVKPGTTVVAIGAPEGYAARLALPPGARLATAAPPGEELRCLHVFAHDRAELRRRLDPLVPALAKGALVWVSYPRLDSALAGDLSREEVWAEATRLGMDAVAQIAVDETWSAMRFKGERRQAAGGRAEARVRGGARGSHPARVLHRGASKRAATPRKESQS